MMINAATHVSNVVTIERPNKVFNAQIAAIGPKTTIAIANAMMKNPNVVCILIP